MRGIRMMASINRKTRTPPLLCLFLLLLLLGQSVSGQKKNTKHHAAPKPPEVTNPTVSSQAPAVPEEGSTPAKPAPAAEPIPVDSLGRSTPYGCVIGFLQAVNDNNLTKAAQYLDTKLPEEKAEELATQLKVVLDAGLSSSINGLSRDLLGNLTDDLRVSRERVGVAKLPNGNVEILLDRVKRPQEAPIWLFSPETLARVPAAYAEIKQPDFSRFFPAPLVRLQLLGLPLWRWLTILVAISLTILLSSAVTRLLFLIFRVFLNKKHVHDEEELLARLKRPVLVLLLAVTITCLSGHFPCPSWHAIIGQQRPEHWEPSEPHGFWCDCSISAVISVPVIFSRPARGKRSPLYRWHGDCSKYSPSLWLCSFYWKELESM